MQQLLQTLSDKFTEPTYIEIIGNMMYVVNYSGHSISVFELHNDISKKQPNNKTTYPRLTDLKIDILGLHLKV